MTQASMEDKVKAGVKALLLCKSKLKKETLLSHDDMKVMLQISAIKVPPGRLKQTIKLPLPAPFHEDAEVCLFVKDLKRGIRVDHDKSVRHWKDLLEEKGVTRVSEVMPLRQLKAEYSMYEARRKLCDAYDVFLTDARVARLLPTLLGKHFVTKKKQPVQVNMEAKDLVSEIDKALEATYLHLYNCGDSSAVQVGRCGQTELQLVCNTMAAVETLARKFPGGLHNVRSLHLKLDKSPAIPIFVSTVSANGVPEPAARRQPGSGRQPVSGELSTARAQSDVTVDRHGNVHVTQTLPLSDDEELTDEELEEDPPGRRGRKRRNEPAQKQAKQAQKQIKQKEEPTEEAEDSTEEAEESTEEAEESTEEAEERTEQAQKPAKRARKETKGAHKETKAVRKETKAAQKATKPTQKKKKAARSL